MYPDGTDDQTVARNLARLDALWRVGAPMPAVHGIDLVGNRIGRIEDRVDAPTMLAMLSRAPRHAVTQGELLASVHTAIATFPVPADLPRLATDGSDLIGASGLPPDAVEALQRLLATLTSAVDPAEDVIVHGRLGPATILPSEPPLVTGWDDATRGPAEADVAATLLQLDLLAPPATARLRSYAVRAHRRFVGGYVEETNRRRPGLRPDRWRAVMAAIELSRGGHPDDRAFLAAVIAPFVEPFLGVTE